MAKWVRRYGVPDEVLTDNAKVFTGRLGPHPVEVLFERICGENGIRHRLTGVRSPTTTGKIERFHKTLRTEFLPGGVFAFQAGEDQLIHVWSDGQLIKTVLRTRKGEIRNLRAQARPVPSNKKRGGKDQPNTSL